MSISKDINKAIEKNFPAQVVGVLQERLAELEEKEKRLAELENNYNTNNAKRRVISEEELQQILIDHKKWLKSDGKIGARACLQHTDLSHAKLFRVDLRRAKLWGSNLEYADLREANLSETDLEKCNLQHADLSSVILTRAYLRDAKLQESNLDDARFEGANIRGVDLSKADLHCTYFTGAIRDYETWGIPADLPGDFLDENE